MASVKKMGKVNEILPTLADIKTLGEIRKIILGLLDRKELKVDEKGSIPGGFMTVNRSKEVELNELMEKISYHTKKYLLNGFDLFSFTHGNYAINRQLHIDFLVGDKGWFFPRLDDPEGFFNYIQGFLDKSNAEPMRLGIIRIGYWVYQGYYYQTDGPYSEDEFKLLILEDFDKERKMFEKLKQKFSSSPTGATEVISYERTRIPENVRIEVWRRDGGKCARCGSRERLEYDHIVPVSKGGSNTARNIELLCETCNRSKGASIQ